MAHKLDKTEYDTRKTAKAELKQTPGAINSVAALKERVFKLELALSVKDGE